MSRWRPAAVTALLLTSPFLLFAREFVVAREIGSPGGSPIEVQGAAAQPYQERDFLSRVRRLTVEGRRSGEGYWSPDGTRLVFQSEREPGNPFYQIYVLDLASGDTKRISPGIGKTTSP